MVNIRLLIPAVMSVFALLLLLGCGHTTSSSGQAERLAENNSVWWAEQLEMRKNLRNAPEIVHIQCGDALMEAGKYRAALKEYETAAQYRISHPDLSMKMVKALENIPSGNRAETNAQTARKIGLLQLAVERNPANEDAYRRLFALLEEAVKEYSRPELIDQLYKVAESCMVTDPSRVYAMRYKAIAQIARLRISPKNQVPNPRIREDIEKALAVLPDDEKVIGGLSSWYAFEAHRLSKDGKTEAAESHITQAEELLKEAIGRLPESHSLRLQLVRTLLIHKKPKEADDLAQELERELLQKPVPPASIHLANILLLNEGGGSASYSTILPEGNARAEKVLEALVAAHPTDATAVGFLGSVKKRLGKTDEAAALLEATIRLSGNPVKSADIKNLEARAAAKVESINIYLRKVEAEKNKSRRAELLEKARVLIADFKSDFPNSPEVLLLEGKLSLVERNFHKAVKLLDAADEAFQGKNLAPAFLAASALSGVGETGEAISRYEKLMKKDPPSDLIIFVRTELARLYLRTADLPKAEQNVNMVLKMEPGKKDALLLKSQILARKNSNPTR